MSTIEGQDGAWEMVIGLETHAQVASKQSFFPRPLPRLAARRMTMWRSWMLACQACCPSSTNVALRRPF